MKLDIDEIRARAEKATAGPLLEREDLDYYQGGIYLGTTPYYYDQGKRIEGLTPDGDIEYFHNDICRIEGSEEDKEFLKMAQADIVNLLDYINKLETAHKEILEIYEYHTGGWVDLANEMVSVSQTALEKE
jgi:hypothetical protein